MLQLLNFYSRCCTYCYCNTCFIISCSAVISLSSHQFISFDVCHLPYVTPVGYTITLIRIHFHIDFMVLWPRTTRWFTLENLFQSFTVFRLEFIASLKNVIIKSTQKDHIFKKSKKSTEQGSN